MQITPFAPNGTTPFEFQASLAGNNYFVKVLYNNYANRYYVQGTDTQNNVAFFTPMVASPVGFDINLSIGFGSLIYRLSTNNFEAT